MNNYNEALRLEQVALDSEGLALERYQIYLESTEAKLARFTATLEGLYSKVISSDTIKKIIDGGTEFINIIDRIISELGGLNTVLILLATGSMIKFVSHLYKITEGVVTLKSTIDILRTSTKALHTSFITLLKNPVTWAVIALAAIPASIFAITNHNKKLKESIEEVNKATSEYKSSLKELNDTLDHTKISDTTNKLEELKEAIDYEDKIKQIKQLKKEIANLEKKKINNDGQLHEIDVEGLKNRKIRLKVLEEEIGVIGEYNKVIELAKILDLESAENKFKLVSANKQSISENKKLADSYKVVYDKLIKGIELTEEETKLNKKLISQYPEHVSLLNSKTGALGISHKALQSSITLQEKLAEVEFQEYKFSIKANSDKINSEINVAQAKMESAQSQIEALDKLIKKENDLTLADPIKRELSIAMGFDSEKFNNQVKEEQKKYRQELIKEQKRLDKLRPAAEVYSNILDADSYKDFIENFYEVTSTASDGSGDIREYTSSLSEFANQLSKISEIEAQLTKIKLESDLVTESDRIPLIQKEIELQKELIKANEELIEAQTTSRNKTAQELINKFGSVVTLSSDLRILTVNWEEYNKVSNTSSKDQKSQREILEDLIKKYNELNSSIDSSATSILNAQKATFDLNKTMENFADEIVSLYKELYETQKEAKIKLIDEEIKKEDKRHENEIDHLDKEIKKYEEIINAKLKLIDEESDKEDYQKELAKLTKERNEIKDKINVLSLDDSIEAKAQIAELNKQLAEQEENINEYQHKHTIDLRKKNLQNQLDTYKKDIDAKKDAEDKKYKAEKESLDKAKQDITDYYDNLLDSERTFYNLKQQIVSGNLESIQSDFANFALFVQDNSKIIGDSISENLNDKIVEAQNTLNNVSKVKKSSNTSSSNSHKDYLDNMWDGGSDKYVEGQQKRYKQALKDKDYDLIRRLIEDSQRVGYKL
nr:hypothetical protein [Candidatus Paceibacterota bacterium]